MPLTLLTAVTAATAQPHSDVARVEALRITDAPTIDGRLDDPCWVRVTPATTFLQRDPDEGQPATERTELRIVYDEAAVYVGARLYDREAGRIARRLSRRDTEADADRFTVYFDPHHDHLSGAMFEVSAAGSLGDAIVYNDTWTDQSWDAVWDAAVVVDDEGWTAEIRIPFSQLRFPAADRDAWGINAARFIQRRNETSWLEIVPKRETGLASRMAHLAGITGIRPPRRLEILPYSVARAEFVAPSGPGDPFNDGSQVFGATGLDLKYGLTSSFTLDGTINPDFGQVEVDPAVVNLSDFETFFDERRPFFIEGAQIFGNFGRNGSNSFWGFNNFEPLIFYSRRIGRPPQGAADAPFAERPSASTILGAAKLTGKTANGWNLGVLDAVTAREHARLAGVARSRAEVEPLSNYFVGRVHREVGRGGFGGLATFVSRASADGVIRQTLLDRAYVIGGDGYWFLDGKRDWVLTGMVAGSRVVGTRDAVARVQRASQRYFQRPDRLRFDPTATSMQGWNGRLVLNRNAGLWQVNAALWGVSPGFESGDLGFTFRSGGAGAHGVLLWRKPTPDRFTRDRHVWVAKAWTWNFDRELQSDAVIVGTNLTFLNYWHLGAHAAYGRRALDDWLTRGGPAAISPAGGNMGLFMGTDSRKAISANAFGNYGWSEFGGWNRHTSVSLNLKPASGVSVSFGPEISRSHNVAQYVRAAPDVTATATYGSRFIFADLDQTQVSMTTRVAWVMSPRMSLQLYVQPLVAVGDYWGLKELARPRTFDFLRYDSLAGAQRYDLTSRQYAIDPDAGGPAEPFTLADPDFNVKSLRLNLVYRWEWRLGSTLYVVWTEQREDFSRPGQFALGRDARGLFTAPGDDVFLVKFSYWLSR